MQVSFGRAIRVISDIYPKTLREVPYEEKAIFNTMEKINSENFDKKSKRIGHFLYRNIGDFNSETGYYLTKVRNKTYLFTGDDVQKAKSIRKKNRKEANELIKMYKRGEKCGVDSYETLKERLNNMYVKCDKALLDMVEDGTNLKPYTSIGLKFNPETKALSQINYSYSGINNKGCFEDGCIDLIV